MGVSVILLTSLKLRPPPVPTCVDVSLVKKSWQHASNTVSFKGNIYVCMCVCVCVSVAFRAMFSFACVLWLSRSLELLHVFGRHA